MKHFFIITIMAISLTSCAGFTQVTVPQSNINYAGGDIETQRAVKYTLTKTYVLGIGGMSFKARNTDIIDELMRKANLQTNESLAYIYVSRNFNTFLGGLFTRLRLTATGHVVRPVNGEYKEDVEHQKQLEIKENQVTGGAKLVRLLAARISDCNTHNALADLKNEVLLHEKNGVIGSADADSLIRLIEDKAVNL